MPDATTPADRSDDPSSSAAPPAARRVPALCVVWAITGVLAIAGAVVGSAHPWSRPGLAALLAAAAITLQIAPIRLGHDAQSEYLHLDEAFLVPMAIFLSAPEMAVGLALAVLAGNLWHRRGWMRTAFNSGQAAATAAVGASVARAAGAGTGAFTGRSAAAAVAGVLVYSVLSMVAVAAIICLAQTLILQTGRCVEPERRDKCSATCDDAI